MYHRASLSVVILQQFLLELCLFVNSEYSKYSVFRTFLLHALTYWAEILHMTLFYCTTDQVRVSSICVNFCGSYAPFWKLQYWKYTVFRTFLLHPLTYWAESLHITLFFCTTDQVWVSSICVFFGVMPSSNLEYCKYSFLHFSLTRFDIIIELKFCTWLCFTVIQVNFECRQWASIFVGEMSLLGLRILEIHSFPHFSPAFFDILSSNFSYNFV